jgi:Domain of unknown function (DUF4148)
MKHTLLTIATVIIAGTTMPALAGEFLEWDLQNYKAPFVGEGKTRAEVKAELSEAMAKGLVQFGERDLPAVETPSTLNRVDVLREAIEANKSRSFIYERG